MAASATLAGAGAFLSGGRGAPPHARTAIVPVVKGISVDRALARLRARGLRIAIPRFPRLRGEPTRQRMSDLVVVASRPHAGVEVQPGAVVTITLRDVPHPAGSPVIPVDAPATATVPDLRGLTYLQLMRYPMPGVYLAIRRIAPLRPSASLLGMDAFRVGSQCPAPGTEVAAYGRRIANGIDTGPSTVRIDLATP